MTSMRSILALLPVAMLSVMTGSAQEYTISTVAGGAPPPTPAVATTASIGMPQGVATDAAGNTYFTSLECVFKIDPNGVLTRVAGTSRRGYSGDGGTATNAQLRDPRGVAVDAGGNLYIADSGNLRIRRVTPGGIISSVAGNGTQGYSGDGVAPTSAQLFYPLGVAVDAAGRIYFSQGDNAVRLLTPTSTTCTYATTPATFSFASAGGDQSLAITTLAGCAWTLTGLPSWITASLHPATARPPSP